MARTTFSGPIRSGTIRGGANANVGSAVLVQSVTLNQNSTNAVNASVLVPKNATLLQVLVDTDTAWNSGTSAVLTVGSTSGGTEYVTSVDVKTGGRAVATHTAAQVTAMRDVGSNTTVYFRITPTGATSAGSTRVHLVYRQN